MILATFHLLAQQAVSTVSTPAAGAPATTGPAGPPPPQWLMFLNQWGLIILMVVLFWFMMSNSKRKQDRERKSLLDNLKKGDRVRLIGGEYGAVVDVKEARVLVKVDESSNTKIWYAREAVAAVEAEEVTAK